MPLQRMNIGDARMKCRSLEERTLKRHKCRAPSPTLSIVLSLAAFCGHAAPAGGTGPLPKIEAVRHNPPQPHSGETVTVSARIKTGAATNITLQYQLVDPGKYIA